MLESWNWPGCSFLPLAPQGSIFSICWSIGKASKNDDFLASHQNVKNQMISRNWEAHVATLDPKTWLLRYPLASFFHRFCEWPKIKKIFVFQYFSMVLDHQKPLIFRSFFHFQSSSPGPFLEGPSADRLWKVSFRCRFRFSWFSKRHPLDDLFAQAGANNLVPRTAGSVLFATLLFTKPQ